jgi:hypothetical protein
MMAKKAQAGDVNKSEEIRQLLKANPKITASEAINAMALRGITVAASLFYFVKGKIRGRRGRRRSMQREAANVMMSNGTTSAGTGDVLATIKKVKTLALEVGGLKKLTALVEALRE